jgi:hypothetical protein
LDAWIFAFIGFNKLKPATAQLNSIKLSIQQHRLRQEFAPIMEQKPPPTPITAGHAVNPYNNANLSILLSSFIKNLIFEMRFLLDRKVVISLCLLK